MPKFKNDETNDIFLNLEVAMKSQEQKDFMVFLITQADEKISWQRILNTRFSCIITLHFLSRRSI